MIETSRVVHVIFHRKISKKVGKLSIPTKIIRTKIICTGLYRISSYGIKKLQITCVIEDDKVMMDDLEDQIVGFEDFVQSMDIVAFNKI